MASASVAGETTRSSSTTRAVLVDDAAGILVPPTSMPQVEAHASSARSSGRRRASRRQVDALHRRLPAAVAGHRGRQQPPPPPGGATRRRVVSWARTSGTAAGRRARSGTPGSSGTPGRRWRCARRSRGRRAQVRGLAGQARHAPAPSSQPWSRAQSATRAEQLGGLLGHADPDLGSRAIVPARARRAARSTNRTRSTPSSTRAPATRSRARPAGRVSRRRYGPTVTTSSSPLRARSTWSRLTNGSARRSTRAGAAAGTTSNGPSPAGAASGSVAAVESRGELAERLDADRLARPVLRAPQRQPGERLLDLGEHVVLGQHPAGPPVVGAVGGEDPVGDDAVDAVAVEGQRRVASAAPRRARRTPGVSTIRTLASGPDSSARTSSSSACSRSTASKTRAAGHRDAGRPGQHRPQRLHHPLLHGEDPLHVPAERLGQREQPQRLGGGRAVDDDDVPVVRRRVQPQLEQRQHLLGARDDGQLLGGDRVDAGDVEHREQVALDLGPGLLEPQLGVDLLHEQVVGATSARAPGPTGRRRSVGQRVRGVGRQHQGAVPGRGGERGGAGGDGGLADAALAGEQEDAHGRASALSQRLDALLQPLERGVDEDLLALALEHPDQRDRDVEGEPVGHLGASRRRGRAARRRRRARAASCPRPGSR